MKLHRFLLPASAATRLFTRGLFAAIAFICPLSEKADAAAYTFTKIVENGDPFGSTVFRIGTVLSINPGLSINNAGTVAFSSALSDGSSGVFTGNGGSIASIALSSSPVFSGLRFRPCINSAGTVAFTALLDAGGSGIFTGNGGPTTQIAASSDPVFSAVGIPWINDAGTVGFLARLDAGGDGIFTSNGGTIRTIALEGAGIFSALGQNLSINSSGTAAFHAFLDNGTEGVFRSDGTTTTTIFLGGLKQNVPIAINDAGTVAFWTSGAIFTGSGGGLTTVAHLSGTFGGFDFSPAINAGGTVAFLAGLKTGPTGSAGIYTGQDPVADKILDTQDTLFGSRVTRVALDYDDGTPGTLDINDLGQVAFRYVLADGRNGIAVATPVVPEPSIPALMLGSASLLAARRVRRGYSRANGQFPPALD